VCCKWGGGGVDAVFMPILDLLGIHILRLCWACMKVSSLDSHFVGAYHALMHAVWTHTDSLNADLFILVCCLVSLHCTFNTRYAFR